MKHSLKMINEMSKLIFILCWIHCFVFSGVIAAFANAGAGFRPALQVSMSHTLFNVFGMIFFFLVPITRRLPICLAKFCGVEAGKYRWWAFMYTASMFFIIPVGLFAISVISVPAATGKYALIQNTYDFDNLTFLLLKISCLF